MRWRLQKSWPRNRSAGNEELTVLHDLLFPVLVFQPDVEAEPYHIDVRRGAPGRTGVFAIGVAEGDVDTGEFFVMQNVSDDVGDADVGADGELTDAVGVLISVRVGPEILLELLIGTGAGDDAILRDLDGERGGFEQSVARTEPVTDDTIDNKGPVNLARRGEAFAAGEIAPLFRRDDAGGFEPPVVGGHLGDDTGARGGGSADAAGAADPVENLLRETIDSVVVCPHAIAHDFRGDVDHVRVAHAAAIDDIGHLHARVEFVGLHLHGKDGDRRGFHVFEDGGRHVCEGALGEVFEDEGVKWAATLVQLRSDGSGDRLGNAIGDEGDLLVRLNAQAGEDGGAGAGDEFSGVRLGQQVRGGCGTACDDGAPEMGMRFFSHRPGPRWNQQVSI